jgi:hypothetical protein
MFLYFQAVMDFAENIVSNPVTIKLRREEESLGDELLKVVRPQYFHNKFLFSKNSSLKLLILFPQYFVENTINC